MAKPSRRKGSSALIFETQNYVYLLVSVVLILVGFVAMYLEGEFLGFISLDVAPIVIMLGYAGVIYAILWRPSEEEAGQESS